MRRNHDIIEVAGELRHETEKAYQFFDGSKTVWLPESQAEWSADDKTMQMPEWLALEKGLYEARNHTRAPERASGGVAD